MVYFVGYEYDLVVKDMTGNEHIRKKWNGVQ
jgi:hypothetical protein